MNTDELKKYITENESNISQIIYLTDEVKLLDINMNDIKSSDSFHIASVTKSIISLLVGIAEDKGFLNVNDKVLKYFPDYIIKKGEKTIKDVAIIDLLTMRAPYKFKSEPWTKVCSSNDWTKSALNLLGGRNGITHEFKYTTLGIQILSGLLYNATKINPLEFANEYLLKPLGIEEIKPIIVKDKEEHIKFILDKKPKEKGWFVDPKGFLLIGFGLVLSAFDLAKFGVLIINDGMYQGKQIISKKYLDFMLTGKVKCDQRFNHMSYGLFWWVIDAKRKIYAAIGDGGNIIYINKLQKEVITITSTFKPKVFNRIEFVEKYIKLYK